jgi:hypothetical protein
MSECIGYEVYPRKMMSIIKELSDVDISYLEIEVLQAIIKFKW